MIPRLLVTVCLLTTATLTAVVPEAQAQDKLQQARQHFDRGTEFFRLGRYDEALDELMKAYVLDPNELLVYNIGRVHEERQDLANALKFFENYLKMNRRAKNRRDVKRRIRRLRKELKNRPAAGVLAVHSVPPGASVRLNGQLVGTTPIKARRMPPGRYRMELALPGFQVWVSDVMLSPGQTTRTDVKMVDPPFPVRITATPQGATATLIAPSRKPLGTCPCSVDLSAGRYRVRVEYPGFQEREFDFVKRPNEPMSLPVTLMPKQILGKLWVDANIPGATVSVDGQPVGRIPLPQPMDIRVGLVNVEVSAPGYVTWRQPINVLPRGISSARAMLQPGRANPALNPMVGTGTGRPEVVIRNSGGTSSKRTWGIVLTTIGSLALAGAATTTTLALLEQRSFESGEFFKNNQDPLSGSLLRQDLTQVQAFEAEQKANDMLLGSYIMGGVGLPLLITGIALLATDDGPDELESLSFRPLEGGGYVSLGGSF